MNFTLPYKLKTAFIFFYFATSVFCTAQNSAFTSVADSFNEKLVVQELLSRGTHESEISGIVAYKKLEYEGIKNGTWQIKTFVPNPTPLAACNNIDFETGTFAGWSGATGYHKNLPGGCCPTPGFITSGVNSPWGRHTIVTGPGTDFYGGFPVVAPGGIYSVRLGNTQVNGEADRIMQTFTVDSSTTSFTYKYAVVLYDPQHAPANQPYFEVNMIDQNNAQIPCSYYFVASAQGIPGFMTSPNQAFVIYKPWSTVNVDLSNYVGQDVTIMFTVSDCVEGGHFGYVYIDALCLPFKITQPDSLCAGSSITLSAPIGEASYSWTPGGQTTPNITVSAPGTYCCTMISYTNCTSQLCHVVTQYSAATPNFSISGGACNPSVSFTDQSTISGGTITGWSWNFGDGNSSTQQNPVHTYTASGTYNVTLVVTSSNGCSSAITQSFTTGSSQLSFSYNPVCLSSPTNFTFNDPAFNTWSWNFGDPSSGNNTSALQNPSHPFSSTGTYSVTLIATTSGGCADTSVMAVSVNPNPIANAGTDVTIGLGQNTTLLGSGGGSYSWSPASGLLSTTDPNSVASPTVTTVYCLTVTDANGCLDNSCMTVFIENNDCSFSATGEIYVPNVFSPNGDMENDNYFIQYGNFYCIETFSIAVFNRWGEKVFESTDPQFKWNGMYKGKNLSSGVYVFYMRVTLIDGTEIGRPGNISILR